MRTNAAFGTHLSYFGKRVLEIRRSELTFWMSRSFAVHLVSLKSKVSFWLIAPQFWIKITLRALPRGVIFLLCACTLRGHAAGSAITAPTPRPNNFSNSRRLRSSILFMEFSPLKFDEF